jgi:hypothetical protein
MFQLVFRLSRGRFQVHMEDVMASNIIFFKSIVKDGLDKCSLAARLLLPLKTMAYGVPPHTFFDYFQYLNSMQGTVARNLTRQ